MVEPKVLRLSAIGYRQGEVTALAIPASTARDGDVSLRVVKGWKPPLQSERTEWPRSAGSGHSRASHRSTMLDLMPTFGRYVTQQFCERLVGDKPGTNPLSAAALSRCRGGEIHACLHLASREAKRPP